MLLLRRTTWTRTTRSHLPTNRSLTTTSSRLPLLPKTIENKVDVVVVGGGVVGLATAREVLTRGGGNVSVAVLEAEKRLGSGISERSSGVIHAGIYYETGSLKAEMCVRGRRLLYQYCNDRGVRHAKLGKLLVATSEEQMRQLMAIKHKSTRNGLSDPDEALIELSREDVRRVESALNHDNVRGALLSPSTGIIDVPAYVDALRAEIDELGGMIVKNCRVRGGVAFRGGDAIGVGSDDEGEAMRIVVETDTSGILACKYLINCAGLSAPAVAASFTTPQPETYETRLPKAFFARGHYYKITGEIPAGRLNHLIYPLPERHGLGVHATLDLQGAIRFGPDVLFVEPRAKHETEAEFQRRLVSPPSPADDEARREIFYRAIRAYYDPPGFTPDRLSFDYAGVRPKLGDASTPARDFLIWGPDSHRVPGLVHCLGVESPGLTSSLALAEWIARRYVFARRNS